MIERDPIRYGVVGCGLMGLEHIEAIAAVAGAEVVAVADPDPSSLEAGGRRAGPGVAHFPDHRQLVAAGDLDAVVIASPNMTHAAVAADLLEAGVHLLIEKPLCTTVDDCQRLVTLASATAPGRHRVIQVGLEYRFMAPIARLVAAVDGGVVGRTRMVAIREHRFPFLDKVGRWNRFNANTGGTLVEKCCHFFDLMNLILGERPHRVMASGAQDVNHFDELIDGRRPDILDNAFVIVDYPSGARASLDLCMFAEATQNQEEVTVVGDRGKVEALIPDDVVRIGRRGEHGIGRVTVEAIEPDPTLVAGHHHGSCHRSHEQFVAAIRSGRPAPVGLDDGLWSVAAGVAAHRSIDEGRPVTLAEILG